MFQEINPSHKNNNKKVTPKIQTLIFSKNKKPLQTQTLKM
jgi:hypothetical protein